MIKKIVSHCALMFSVLGLLTGCSEDAPQVSDGKLNVVTTTTYLSDLASVIGGEQVAVTNLCGPGVDPHTYVATMSDVKSLQSADVIAYSGVGLEAQLADLLGKLKVGGAQIISAEASIAPDKLLSIDEDGEMVHDPHVWNDVKIWKDVAKGFAQQLAQFDAANAAIYRANLEAYLKELDQLDAYASKRIQEIPSQARILITMHDAFGYMGRAYGLQVDALTGLSTATEAGVYDIEQLADKIVNHQIKAVFFENIANSDSMKALTAAVVAKGGSVVLGGELYSDALGDESSGRDTYIKVIKGNIDTIVDALK